jgi:hypothetical protein
MSCNQLKGASHIVALMCLIKNIQANTLFMTVHFITCQFIAVGAAEKRGEKTFKPIFSGNRKGYHDIQHKILRIVGCILTLHNGPSYDTDIVS